MTDSRPPDHTPHVRQLMLLGKAWIIGHSPAIPGDDLGIDPLLHVMCIAYVKPKTINWSRVPKIDNYTILGRPTFQGRPQLQSDYNYRYVFTYWNMAQCSAREMIFWWYLINQKNMKIFEADIVDNPELSFKYFVNLCLIANLF